MRGKESMENLRVALMDLLGKGGRKFREFDDAYAEAVRQKLMYEQGDPRASSPIGVIRNMMGAVAGTPITHGPAMMVAKDGTEYMPRTFAEKAAGYGVPAAGATARYVLPAAGVTLAGKGLMDIAAMLGDDDEEVVIQQQVR